MKNVMTPLEERLLVEYKRLYRQLQINSIELENIKIPDNIICVSSKGKDYIYKCTIVDGKTYRERIYVGQEHIIREQKNRRRQLRAENRTIIFDMKVIEKALPEDMINE